MPPPMARPHSTWQASFAHNYCVELSNSRINWFSDVFFPSTSRLWNSLPSYVFLAFFNFPSKGRPITTLGTRRHDFFYYPFRYFINLFYPFHCLSFPFLRDADSREFCVTIHKKKRNVNFTKPVSKEFCTTLVIVERESQVPRPLQKPNCKLGK